MEAPPQPNRFELANRIFSEALSVRPDERGPFIRQRCATDAALGESVLRLLSQFDGLGYFLEEPAAKLTASQLNLQNGALLCGRFRILERIGGGGMGEVFRAEDLALGEIVALKAIRCSLRSNATMLTRFREEIRLARKISHANICKIFDLFTENQGDHGPIDFFTMQYLQGETLAARIATAAPFPRSEVLRIADQIAQGLDAAHLEGIIHRDLKPANIVLLYEPGSEVRPVITDFGLARPFEREPNDVGQTQVGQIMGSLDYMAPEQFEGITIQPAADVFAFGIIVFEMLTGQRPYPSESIIRAAVRRLTEPPLPVRRLAPETPPHWERAIHKALARHPEDRYISAGAMVRELAYPRRSAALSAHLAPPKPTRRSLVTGGVIAASVAAYFGISRLGHWGPALPAAPILMLNPLTHGSNDALESGTLDITLASQLSQSAHVHLLNREWLERSWRLIKGTGPDQFPPSIFEPQMAREIAMRSGAQIVVFGGFGRVGDQRTLTLQVELMGSSPDHPRKSWLRHFDTNRPFELAAIGHEAAAWVRRTVGETENELDTRNRPPEELTTPYWLALKEYVQANESLRLGNPDGAVLHLTTAIRIDPDFALGAARLADILRSEGRLDEALDYWGKAAEILSRRNLTDRESLRVRGLFALDTGQVAEAEQIFARYALEYADDGLPLFYRASALDRLGRYEEAERLHTLAIGREPLYSFVMGRANFYLSRDRLDEAEKDWRTGREMNSRDWTDQIRMAIAFARGNFREVRASLEHLKLTGTAAAKSRAYVLEACLRVEQGDVDGSEELFQAGIAFDRTMGLPLSSLLEKQYLVAQLLLVRRPAEAVRFATAALGGNVGHAVRMQFGSVLARAGNIQSAKECLTSGLPDWPVYQVLARRLEGEIAFAQRDFKKALRLFRQAVQHRHMRIWPDFLVRAALAAGDDATVGETLHELFFAPGIYWLGAERNTPGFVSNAIETVRQTAQWPELSKRIDLFAELTDNRQH